MIPEPSTQDTFTGELLKPISDAIERSRVVLGLAVLVVMVALAGAKLERYLMKRHLSVLDGAQEESDGGRS